MSKLVRSGKLIDVGREDRLLIQVMDADVVSGRRKKTLLVNADGGVFCEGNTEDVVAED